MNKKFFLYIYYLLSLLVLNSCAKNEVGRKLKQCNLTADQLVDIAKFEWEKKYQKYTLHTEKFSVEKLNDTVLIVKKAVPKGPSMKGGCAMIYNTASCTIIDVVCGK